VETIIEKRGVSTAPHAIGLNLAKPFGDQRAAPMTLSVPFAASPLALIRFPASSKIGLRA
jgi:hypothetical protein